MSETPAYYLLSERPNEQVAAVVGPNEPVTHLKVRRLESGYTPERWRDRTTEILGTNIGFLAVYKEIVTADETGSILRSVASFEASDFAAASLSLGSLQTAIARLR